MPADSSMALDVKPSVTYCFNMGRLQSKDQIKGTWGLPLLGLIRSHSALFGLNLVCGVVIAGGGAW